jgi:hypothetical protein
MRCGLTFRSRRTRPDEGVIESEGERSAKARASRGRAPFSLCACRAVPHAKSRMQSAPQQSPSLFEVERNLRWERADVQGCLLVLADCDVLKEENGAVEIKIKNAPRK